MALVNIDTVLQETIRIIRSCPPGSGIELMSYKRDRTVAIVKIDSERPFSLSE